MIRACALSILERIVGVETRPGKLVRPGLHELSVSSNGSLGLKLHCTLPRFTIVQSFSILERIVGVETRSLASRPIG